MIHKLKRLYSRLFGCRQMRYIAAGGVNFMFGYFMSVAIYYNLRQYLCLIGISIIANIICISFSFISYKLFVFRTRGNWMREYLRCYIVYGSGAVISIFCIWLMVDVVNIRFWIAQGMVLIIIVVISYFAHCRFSFATRTVAEVPNKCSCPK